MQQRHVELENLATFSQTILCAVSARQVSELLGDVFRGFRPDAVAVRPTSRSRQVAPAFWVSFAWVWVKISRLNCFVLS
jgi:hypothetical protein